MGIRRHLSAKVLTIAFALSSMCSGATWAAAPPAGFPVLDSFRHFGSSNLLACVFSLAVDHEGRLWLADQGMLHSYDGTAFRHWRFDPNDPGSFYPGQVTSLAVDGEDGILVAGGMPFLQRLDQSTGTFTRLVLPAIDGANVSAVYSVFVDSRQGLWVATDMGIFVKPAKGTFSLAVPAPRTPSDPFFASGYPFAESPGGDLVVGTPWGVLRLATGSGMPKAERVDALDSVLRSQEYEVLSLTFDRDGELWVGTNGKGLVRTDRNLRPLALYRATGSKGALSSSSVNALLCDRSGRVWVGTNGGGLCRYDAATDSFETSRYDPSRVSGIGEDSIKSIMEDSQGLLWFGNLNNGLDLLDPRVPVIHSELAGVPTSGGFVEMEDGGILVGTARGPAIFDRRSGRTRFLGERFPALAKVAGGPSQILKSDDGSIWLADFSAGLSVWNPKSGAARHYEHSPSDPTSLPASAIWAVGEDSQSRLWLGSWGEGVFIRSPGREGFVPLAESGISPRNGDTEAWKALLASRQITNMHRDRHGTLWIGTYSDGLFSFDAATGGVARLWTGGGKGHALPIDSIVGIMDARDGGLWVSFWFAGAGHLDPLSGEVRTYASLGEPDNLSVTGLAEDAKGNLWMPSYGLICLDASRTAFRRFDSSDGLPAGGNSGMCSSVVTSDGEVFMTSMNGFFHFRPEQVEASAFMPRVAAQRVLDGGGQPIAVAADPSRPAFIPWQRNGIECSFAAVDLRGPARTLYAAKLEGLDRTWVNLGSLNSIRYTNLAPGRYTLVVKGTNNNGAWTSEDRYLRIPFSVGVHPARSWWAITLYTLAALGAGWLAIDRNRRRQAAALERQAVETRREREARERLERFDKLKDAFLANTSHELRTPLHGIIGIAESLSEGATGELPGRTVANLDLIASSGRRLASLVDDILDFSKLGQGELRIERRPFNLARVAEIASFLVAPLAAAKGLALAREVPEDLSVTGDAGRVQQILVNLLGNAVKFTEKGSITLAALPAGADGRVRLSVRDTGIGIPRERLADIFRPFERVEDGDAALTHGTGLGLSVTKSLVELHGGTIEVESIPGEGSVFSFSLEAAATEEARGTAGQAMGRLAHEAAVEAPREATAAGRGKPADGGQDNAGISILVVDDEPVNLQVLANQLSLERYHVQQATNGPDAVELCRRTRPDLILLDIMMPRMDGYEVCQRIRETFPSAELPVIMLTAKNQVSDLVAGLSVGANDYMPKPFSRRELSARIRTHLELARINKAYGRFVPRELLTILDRESIIDVRLGDQVQREMTVMFADIRSFTTLSESMSPSENFGFINEYFGAVVPAIRAEGGIVDKYLGDGVMALFPGGVESALRAGVGMQRAVDNFNARMAGAGREPIAIGIGLHSGSLIVGTIGEESRMDETVISDAVNLASRIEGLTKLYGSPVLLSERTRMLAGDNAPFGFRFLGKVAVKGKREPTAVYELLESHGAEALARKAQTRADFERGIELYYSRAFDEASVTFGRVLKVDPADRAAEFYRRKAAQFVLTAPSADWDGVEVLDTK